MTDLSTIMLMLLSVGCGAVADGMNENGERSIGHPIEAAEKVLLLLAGVLTGSWLILISYTAFRVSLFDILKNIAKGQKWSYMSEAEDAPLWDRFLSKYPVFGVTFGRIIFLAFAIGFTIKEF